MSNKMLTELVESGVHYGHQSRKWHPRIAPYVLQKRNHVHIINVQKTAEQIETAANFLSDLSAKKKNILFVGCKRQAQDAVKEAADACKQFYVNHRWLGGTLTNLETIRKSVDRLAYLDKLEGSEDAKAMSKKEIAALGRERNKLTRNLDGIRGMEKKPDAVVVVDSDREKIAVHEAKRLNIPVVAMVDTNADPTEIDYPIVSNDDAIRSIRIVLQNLIDPVIASSK